MCEVRGLEQQSPPSPSWGGGGGGGRGSEIVGGGGFGAGMITTLPQRRKSSGKRSAIMVDLHHRGNLGEILCSYPLTLFIAQLTKPLSLFYFFNIIIKRSTIARTPRNTRPLHAHHENSTIARTPQNKLIPRAHVRPRARPVSIHGAIIQYRAGRDFSAFRLRRGGRRSVRSCLGGGHATRYSPSVTSRLGSQLHQSLLPVFDLC